MAVAAGTSPLGDHASYYTCRITCEGPYPPRHHPSIDPAIGPLANLDFAEALARDPPLRSLCAGRACIRHAVPAG